jgi:hypothetical protein
VHGPPQRGWRISARLVHLLGAAAHLERGWRISARLVHLGAAAHLERG